jgi:membrane protease YdiL (CAAX protease family)
MVTDDADEHADTLRLVRWWVVVLLLAWYPVRDMGLLMAAGVVAVTAAAAAGLVVALRRRPPQDTAGKVVVYVCAVVANQGADIFFGFAAMAPGTKIDVVAPPAFAVAYVVARVLLAVWTFQLVRTWLARDLRDPLQQNTTRRTRLVSGIAVAAASLVMLYVANVIYTRLAGLLGTPEFTIPAAPGGTTGFVILAVSLGLAGVVEEPVFVGIAVLLWPRSQSNGFVVAAVVSILARSTIHMYYAAGAGAETGLAVVLVIFWCAMWSGFNLYLVHRTGRLWPVIVAHGLQNVAAIAVTTVLTTEGTAASLTVLGVACCYLVLLAGTIVYLVMRIRAVRA